MCYVLSNRKLVDPLLAELNTKYRELRWEKIGYFIMHGTIWKLELPDDM